LATTYYTVNSGLGVALDFVADRGALRIGVVGLGVGTAAAHARDGDFFRFYEINPDVVLLAEHLFSFLNDAKKRGATCEIVLGDARLSLERDEDQQFDLLVVDAFSGDAVPAHLLSLEAVEVYLRHLTPDGLLAVHISNRYLDLRSVLLGAARHHDLDLVWINHVTKEPGINTSQWMLLSRRGVMNNLPAADTIRRPGPDQKSVIWTDDYSNLFGILK